MINLFITSGLRKVIYNATQKHDKGNSKSYRDEPFFTSRDFWQDGHLCVSL